MDMKHTLFLLLFIVITVIVTAQTVNNVSSRLEGGRVAVSFNLQSPLHCTLSYSADGGKTYLPCKTVTGDTDNKTTGTKTIYWDYFADEILFGDFLFKVEALVNIEMVFVRGGTFYLGKKPDYDDEFSGGKNPNESQTYFKTVDDFYIGKYEITQIQWKAIMGNNPSKFKGDNKPVESISWNDAQKFIKKLNEITGKEYRLPTEAEWEYAARGGSLTHNYKYSGSNNIDDVTWYSINSGSITHTVGSKLPNELGIYDMSGNVWEWCNDYYKENDNYILKGGSYSCGSKHGCSVIWSIASSPDDNGGGFYGHGLRLASSR